jgi:prolyl oligopeptidase
LLRFILPAASLLLAAAAAPASDDPYLWLEEIEGQRALDQVKQWNKATEDLLTNSPGFERYRARARAILDDEQQIASPESILGDQVTNLWRDAKKSKGCVAHLAARRLCRRQAAVADPHRHRCARQGGGKELGLARRRLPRPQYRRCLVSLSPGGTDANVVREFDLSTGKLIEGGFSLPEAKHEVGWVDADRLLVVTNYGPESLTTSGYGRVAKIWRRGTPLAQAETVFTGEKADVGVAPITSQDGDTRWVMLNRNKTYWTNELFLLTRDGKLVKMPVPETANYRDVIAGRLIASLNAPVGSFPAGAVVAYSLEDIAAGREAQPELVMAPSKTQAIESVAASDNVLWVKALDNVSGKLFALTRGNDRKWTGKAMPLAANSTVNLSGVAGRSDTVFATVESMLTPPSLYALRPGAAPQLVQSLPARFDAALFAVEQRFATSKDGTRVPYFLVRKKGVKGPMPSLIHAYGGFRSAQTPSYLTGQPYRAGPLGLFWVESGNAYVLANIRGGGEYGPAWHEAALKENRQRSFDDFHAVAEDLIRSGVTAKGKIGISGRSNGGVLVGAAMNQRPDLYSAVISGSPLHDMKRYSHLLAGASWMDEYGDPDKPEEWAYMSKYSPYQNLKRGVKYPAVFFYSSTKDDRVHPGHARKMAARLGEYGNRFYFHEYLEGGHSVGADHAEDAYRAALLNAYLSRELKATK